MQLIKQTIQYIKEYNITMAKILKLNPILVNAAQSRTDYNAPVRRDPLTPDEARRIMRGIEYDDDEDLHIHATFISIDDYCTGLVGDFDAIRPLIKKLGQVQEREHIYGENHSDRGPGIILSVPQTMRLIELMEKDGWEDLNPDVRRVAEARYNALVQINYK